MTSRASSGDRERFSQGVGVSSLPHDAALMQAAADSMHRGLLVFDTDARVLACNRSAWRTVESLAPLSLVPLAGPPGSVPTMRLAARDASLQADIEQAVAECAAGAPAIVGRAASVGRGARTLLLQLHEDQPSLVLHLARLDDRCPPVPAAPLTPAVLGTLVDRARVPRLDAYRLAELFDLSASSARVAEAYLRVDSVKDASRVLGISTNTVKTHLAAVYEKTGCSRQSQLVRLLMTLASVEPV